MGYPKAQSIWELVDRQHGVVARWQLLEFGLSARSIGHRVSKGRLHLVARGVYAVGRPRLTRHGRWMAAVLCCGPDAALSHEDAGALWGMRSVIRGLVHVSVPAGTYRRRPGIVVHRRAEFEVIERHGIPVTSPTCTLVDIAPHLDRGALEAAINEADKLDLVGVEELRAALDTLPPRPGLGILRQTIDRGTFTLTDSELERLFLPIARRAGLWKAETGRWINGYKVDFYWPELGLVVETHGWRYHRTPAQQSRDLRRQHIHIAAGLTPMSFTHGQVRFEPGYVEETLTDVARRLSSRPVSWQTPPRR